MSNTITVTGNLGADPDLKFLQSGDAVLNFRVADSENRKNRDTGEWENVGTTWWGCSLFGSKAESAAELLRKGVKVMVTGRAKLREYERKDGDKGTSLEIRVQDVAVVPRAQTQAEPVQPEEAPF